MDMKKFKKSNIKTQSKTVSFMLEIMALRSSITSGIIGKATHNKYL